MHKQHALPSTNFCYIIDYLHHRVKHFSHGSFESGGQHEVTTALSRWEELGDRSVTERLERGDTSVDGE